MCYCVIKKKKKKKKLPFVSTSDVFGSQLQTAHRSTTSREESASTAEQYPRHCGEETEPEITYATHAGCAK